MGKDQELLEAARNGNVAVVEKILNQRAKRSGPLASLRRGPGANVQDTSGYSALHHAALNGHHDIVELLLTHEASTNILDSKGSSPLHLAAWAGNIDIVRLLLCHGPSVPNVNLTTKDNETALHCAAQYGHTEVVTLLLEHSCDPTIRNSREETALDLAAQYGRLETVELLVRTHPELIQPYSRSFNSGIVFPHTPLHLASRNGHKSVVEVLLSAGMDVNIKTSGGTALHEAALCGKLDVVRTLLDAGVDLCVRDAKQNTVIDLLSQFPKHVTQDIFKTLKRYPARQKNEESDSEMGSLPPIPVPDPNLGSPYENVRGVGDRSGRLNLRPSGVGMDSSPGTSPIHHWDYYSQYRDEGTGPERGMSRSLVDSSFLSEDSYQRDVDQLSISSAASSTSGPSPRERRMVGPDYVPMGPGSIPSPGSNNSKVSPAPPKKPPRRNLSVSPTHLIPQNSLTSPGAYEYLYLARSGEFAPTNRKPEVLRRGKSADQYEVMKLRQSYITHIDFSDSPVLQRRKSEDSGKILHEKREPVALTMYCDNIQVRTTNPRRKLRRNPSDRDKVYENYEPMLMSNAETVEDGYNRTFVSNAYITLKSSQESLLDDSGRKTKTPNGLNRMICPLSPTNYQQPPTPDHPPPSAFQAEICIHERIRPLSQSVSVLPRKMPVCPDLLSMMCLSPTENKQVCHQESSSPSSDDTVVEFKITRTFQIRKEYKRRSRDIETETEEELLIYPMMIDSSGSFSSTVSLSDKSVSTDNNVEEYIGDMPFAEKCECPKRYYRNFFLWKYKSEPYLPAIKSESKREEILRRRHSFLQKMLNDDGYYSIEHNPRKYGSKSDATTQTPYNYRDNGLFRGSIGQLMEVNQRSSPAERPKSLKKLKNVYENEVTYESEERNTSSTADKSLSILSPFDEQEEWAKISEIMASFSSGFVRESVFVAEMEKEIQARLGLTPQKKAEEPTKIGQWLREFDMGEREAIFLNNGYDDLDFLQGILDEEELKNIGIPESDIERIMQEVQKLPNKISEIQKKYPRNDGRCGVNDDNNNAEDKDEGVHDGHESDPCKNEEDGEEGGNEAKEQTEFLVESWLESIHLGIYKDTFRRHLYTDLERVKRIWEVELTAVLEISRSGHRRRILASLNSSQKGGAGSEPNLEELNADLSQLKCNIQQLKEEIREKLPAAINSPTAPPPSTLAPPGTGTLRHSHKKNRPAPPPPVAVNGTPAKTTSSPVAPDLTIRNPSELLVGVPSTLTTQWRHRPEELVTGSIKYVANYLGSTVVKELRGTESTKKSIQKLKKTSKELTATPDIMLAISYRGVKFLNTGTQCLVCEHEIRNIHCACQDADDLTHFAYITKDHISRSHYCHVFCVETMDQATEVILTLGQAFEVAYQMALKEQFSTGRGHTRSQSANQIHGRASPSHPPNHSRTLSVNEMKVNGSSDEGRILEQPGKAPLVANDDL